MRWQEFPYSDSDVPVGGAPAAQQACSSLEPPSGEADPFFDLEAVQLEERRRRSLAAEASSSSQGDDEGDGGKLMLV